MTFKETLAKATAEVDKWPQWMREAIGIIKEMGKMSTGFLRGINTIHGQVVRHENDLVQRPNDPGAENAFIVIDYGENSIKFHLQNGSRDDISKPGVHLESVLEVVRVILEAQTDQYPCPELERALGYLNLAIKQMARWTAYRDEHGAAGCIKHRRDGEPRCGL